MIHRSRLVCLAHVSCNYRVIILVESWRLCLPARSIYNDRGILGDYVGEECALGLRAWLYR